MTVDNLFPYRFRSSAIVIIAAFLPKDMGRGDVRPYVGKIVFGHARLNFSNDQSQFHTVRGQDHQMHMLRHNNISEQFERILFSRHLQMLDQELFGIREIEIFLALKAAEGNESGHATIIKVL